MIFNDHSLLLFFDKCGNLMSFNDDSISCLIDNCNDSMMTQSYSYDIITIFEENFSLTICCYITILYWKLNVDKYILSWLADYTPDKNSF